MQRGAGKKESQRAQPRKIAVVLKGYPRLSETFIAQEIYELEQRGLLLTLISLRHPTDKKRHPVHRLIMAPVHYLPEYLHREPLRVFRAWLRVRRLQGYGKALRCLWHDVVRDRSRNRLRRFGQAIVFASEMSGEIDRIYAHFLHTPSSVARYASLITGLPWSASAHAKDIWTTPVWDLKEKLHQLQWLATCTGANYHYLRSLTRNPERVHLVYHGLCFERFSFPQTLDYSRHDGRSKDQMVHLISVGRAVAKKGYDVLLEALQLLPDTCHWRLTHIGSGELLVPLQEQARRLGIADNIDWLGARSQEEVLARYRQADLFVLACKVVENGDRDGLPNVLMEAQSQGLCCLSTRISGIPELIEDGQNGVLVSPENSELLARAMAQLISRPDLREKLGRRGSLTVRETFDVKRGIDRLMHLFNDDGLVKTLIYFGVVSLAMISRTTCTV